MNVKESLTVKLDTASRMGARTELSHWANLCVGVSRILKMGRKGTPSLCVLGKPYRRSVNVYLQEADLVRPLSSLF